MSPTLEEIYESKKFQEETYIILGFDNVTKVRNCYHFLKNENMLPTEKSDMWKDKDEIQSNQVLLTAKDPSKMKHLYNLNHALCLAPPGSVAMGTAYAERSFIYFECGFYKFCLENIKLAMENNCPQDMRAALEDRKRVCEETREKDAFDLYGVPGQLQLSYEAKEGIPSMADVFECKQDTKYGWSMMAKRDLVPGDIILMEDPFERAVKPTCLYSNCYNCSRHNFYNLMPSERCTRVMFCSKECTDVAWQRYYKWEHEIIDGIFGFLDIFLPLRIVLKAFTMEDPAELKKTIETAGFDFTARDDKTRFQMLYCMSTNEEKRTVQDRKEHIAYVALVFHMFKEFTEFKHILADHEDLFLDLLLRVCYIDALNSFSIPCCLRRKPDRPQAYTKASIGDQIFLLHTFFNHSCASNVHFFPINFHGGFGSMVLRPVKAGEQLFLCYGPAFAHKNRIFRQEELLSKYHFKCECIGCSQVHVYEHTTKDLISVEDLAPINALSPDICKFDDETPKLVDEAVKSAFQLLDRYSSHFPCYDLVKLEHNVMNLMHVLVCKKPLDLILEKKVEEPVVSVEK